ncbi:MAG: DUF975 family protein [Bacilli bacterium]|nr:DUF975 family protein [Bacilli bacterium]
MYCKKCGKEINDDATFCPFCGENVNGKETSNGLNDLKNYRYKRRREYDGHAIKQEAKDALKGNVLMMFVVLLIIGVIGSAASATVVGSLITPIFGISVFWVSKNLLINKKVDLDLMWKPIDDFSYFLRVVGAGLLVALITAIGLLLLIVPGVIFALMYSQTIRIMADDKNISISEAMDMSKKMMDGHKWELFVFELSFIGHVLLTAITFGLWGIYFAPFYEVANTNYYFYLKGLESKNEQEITTF